ncbi:filamentous haemagglutinin family protein [Hyphomicrobium sp. NDB2Meth4]|uniref:filamentous haemagglutinin family protein n=1 Tax=Hyphomicrobium sp. NDB2Meth4 TaxID=1892846 RepID=UPI0009F9B699|nr:filamentous haemagglutinin family protein [Hyphomicrobium sp. NDB2Meth4]
MNAVIPDHRLKAASGCGGQLRHWGICHAVIWALLLSGMPADAKPLGGQQVTPSAAAIAAQQAAQDAATNAARDAGNALKRATLAIQAQQASQQAARDAAKAALSAMPNAVNGLGAGGLVIGNGVVGNGGVINTELWQGANLPTQFSDGDRTKVGIEQTQGKAILTWDTFNVGGKTDLTFDQQGNRDWVALNRVTGGTAPSQILGTIKADGSVYVINQNGIVFGGASQVNVGSLIASTANIANEQFLNAGIYAPLTGTVYTPSFMGAGNGKVLVERGAQIGTHDPKSVTSGGGTVMLLGSEVENWGSINTPLGQALLAAGDDFVLRRGYGTDANQSSTTRGSEVSVGTWNGTTFTPGGLGTVSNSGEIYASEGDITLAAHAIRQDGVLIASTSVNTRGTIHLLNSVRDTTGSIVLGSGSVTSVIPDLASGATALNSQRDALIKASDDANVLRGSAAAGAFDNLSLLADRLDQSRIEIVTGGNVTFEGNSISSAQGGQIAVSAKGRIFNAEGSVLDVSGVRDVQLAMANNNILVNIQGNELRDSPQNRDNDYLKNADVWVDVRNLTYVPAGTGGYDSDRYYTPGGLLEVGGYLANTAHGIGEWSSVGGTITLSASEVIAQKGAIFDISGGSVSYAGGYIQTTNFLGRDGKLYNVNDARADMTFYGLGEGYIRSNDRWGITEVWTNPLGKGRVSTRWEDGYTVGRDAGRLNLSTPTAVFEADILADVVQGAGQTSARPSGITDGYKASQSTVSLAGTMNIQTYLVDGTAFVTRPVNTSLLISSTKPAVADGIWLDAGGLDSAGLGGLWAAVTGTITVDAPLTMANGGGIALYGSTVAINGDITARGGSIELGQTTNESLVRNTSVTVANGVTLDARGLPTNQIADPASALSRLAYINGGAVTLRSYGDVSLGEGSSINASAGSFLSFNGKFNGGNGGDITLVASQTQQSDDGSSTSSNHGDLTLNGTLASYGFGKGGKLNLETGGVVSISGTSLFPGETLPAGTAAPLGLVLASGFTVPAGGVLPMPASVTITSVANGHVFPAGATIASQRVTLSSDWVLPTGIFFVWTSTNSRYFQGDTVPAGTVLTQFVGSLPDGYRIPDNTFQGGLAINPVTVSYAAGTIAPDDIAYAAGVAVPKGTVLPTDVAIQRVTTLSPSLFQSGFSNYSVNGQSGLNVADGVAIDAVMPVLQYAGSAPGSLAGTNNANTAPVWTPPVYQEDAVNGRLIQRAGVGLALLSGVGADGTGYSSRPGYLMVGSGASITVDPGQSVRLASSGQVTVDGTVTAPGGSIAIANTYGQGNFTDPGTMSIWIGDHAVLNAAAQPYIATDIRGRFYGVVPDGGSINIGSTGGLLRAFDTTGQLTTMDIEASSHAYVVIRPGAVLDASGTSGTLDLFGDDGAVRSVVAASDGGTIALRSYSGIYAEGTMSAFAGGPGASGGSLTVNLEHPYQYGTEQNPIPAALLVDRVLSLTQTPANGLAANAQPGSNDLTLGQSHIAISSIAAGGFDTLSLMGRDTMAFDGNVSLSLGRSLSLNSRLYIDPAGGNVSLFAPYVDLAGTANQLYRSAAAAATGTLAISADLMELSGTINPAFTSTTLSSSSDLRFVSNTNLYAPHDLTLSAARIYPTSGVTAVIRSGYGQSTSNSYSLTDTAAVLTFTRPHGTTSVSTPYSAYGGLDISAPTINQGGALFAPFGSIKLFATTKTVNVNSVETKDAVVTLKAGSITSISGAGLVMPYGGTTDGVNWTVDGAAPAWINLITGEYMNADGTLKANETGTGVSLQATSIVSEAGALVDLSGGGTLTGAGFVAGRGGSVDTLLNPLNKGGTVYAILPGVVTAPVAGGYNTAWTGATPGAGQQITIPSGVPGLPAGTHTLLPANYALLPGAYRIELGGASTTALSGAIALPGGSYALSGYQSVANTVIRDALPTSVTITPGGTVRTLAQYNETSFDSFAIARAQTFQNMRPRLETDAKNLRFSFGSFNTTMPALVWDGTADLTPGEGGYGGSLSVTTSIVSQGNGQIQYQDLILAADGSSAARSAAQTVLLASDLDAIGAPNLFIGAPSLNALTNVIIVGSTTGRTQMESGAVLRAGQVLTSEAFRLDDGARIDTRSFADTKLLDASTGYYLSVGLGVSNGDLLLDTSYGGKAISIGDGAAIYSRGTIALNGGVSFDGTPLLGTKTLSLTAPSINLGSAGDLAAARTAGVLPDGLNLTKDLFTALLAGDPAHDVAGARNLQLASTNSLNVYGGAYLDLSALDSLTLTTPAIYGAGASTDNAVLKVNELIWNVTQRVVSTNGDGSLNYGSALPGAIIANGPGAGQGKFEIDARTITFGHPPMLAGGSTATFDRLMLGFSNVTLAASERVTSFDNNSLSVWRSGTVTPSFAPKTFTGEVAELRIVTPLLTGEAGSVLSVYAGGMLRVRAPGGASAVDTSAIEALGATINLNSVYSGVQLDTAVALPSGKLAITAQDGIDIYDRTRIDLSGRAVQFNDVTKYSWGGDLDVESEYGSISFFGTPHIDVSAVNNAAGSISLTATDSFYGGSVAFYKDDRGGGPMNSLDGLFAGISTGGYDSGSFTVNTYGFSNSDFALVNQALNRGGFFGSRSFSFRAADLIIGDELKAHDISVSANVGNLTVNGRIDASGARPGSIRLAAGNNLTVASTAILDVHGSELQVDSYGQPIEAKNRGTIELTSVGGTLTLASGATLDLSTPTGAYGQLVLNASRNGGTSGDVRVSAGGPLNIRGASSIALNAVLNYGLFAPGTVITQEMLDSYDVASQAFIRAAYNNNVAAGQLTASLQGKLAGLTAYGSAFHLRPGVEIASGGDLSTSGDIDLSKYRYGPGANRDTNSSNYGAGEPMALVVRAGGNLTIGGSISDGFKGRPAAQGNPPVYRYSTTLNVAAFDTFDCTVGECGASGTVYFLPQDLYLTADWTVPNDAFYRGLASAVGPISSTSGTQYLPGQTIPAGTRLSASSTFLEKAAALPSLALTATLVQPGTTLPALTATSPLAPMLAPGSLAASIRLVAGADISAASSRVLRPYGQLEGAGSLSMLNPLGGTTPSVVRTGTGSLDLLAGGNITMNSLYGVYTAGTDTGTTGLAAGSYMPDHGGDLTVIAQGDVTGYSYDDGQKNIQSWSPDNWLLRSVDDAGLASWSIAFGRNIRVNSTTTFTGGFAGIGTLGGGNVTLVAGGNVGAMTRTVTGSGLPQIYGALQVAVGGSGKVTSVTTDGSILTGGTLIQAGGGDLTVKVGGTLNGGNNAINGSSAARGSLSIFSNLRGDTQIAASSIGSMAPIYGRKETGDPRGLDPTRASIVSPWGGIGLVPGDGTMTVRTAGDLVIGNYGDAGQIGQTQQTTYLSLWQPETTSVSLFAAGGDLVPVTGGGLGYNVWSSISSTMAVAPARFSAVAMEGSLFLGSGDIATLELAPSANGALELLAGGAIYGASLAVGNSINVGSLRIDVSGASAGVNDVPNPFRPVSGVSSFFSYKNFATFRPDGIEANPNTSQQAIDRIYAMDGDILNVAFGEVNSNAYYSNAYHTIYFGNRAVRVTATGDIVNFGAGTSANPGLILNNDSTDVSMIKAGGNIFYANVNIAGPGSLEVIAGGNIYQGDKGSIVSIGALAAGDTRPGASILMQAGVGTAGPNYAGLLPYLDPANLAVVGTPLAEQSDKVAKTYEKELQAWLDERFGFTGADDEERREYFASLASEQQAIFLRQVYFAELKAGGREYNNPDSSRYGSYLRGRAVIEALFPEKDANGEPIVYAGDITMFGGSGVRTQFGGDIQMLTPGGRTVIGVEGLEAPASAGIVTQGQGNISMYSKGSILLGLSRIMTTMGGDILAWSAEGDINAGRGSKTTIVYTPPKRVYDNYGNVTLAPNVPSSGAGIASRSTIPGVPGGDIDLIAPLGTIDAGEAGIRAGANVNLVALQIINAANIQAQGNVSGVPQIQAPNIGGLTEATNTAGAAQAATKPQQQGASEQASVIIVEVIGFGGGDEEDESRKRLEKRGDSRGTQVDPSQDPASAFQVLGAGEMTAAEAKELIAARRGGANR